MKHLPLCLLIISACSGETFGLLDVDAGVVTVETPAPSASAAALEPVTPPLASQVGDSGFPDEPAPQETSAPLTTGKTFEAGAFRKGAPDGATDAKVEIDTGVDAADGADGAGSCSPPPSTSVGCSATVWYSFPGQYCVLTPSHAVTPTPTPAECQCDYTCACLMAHVPCPTGMVPTAQPLGIVCEVGSNGGIALGCQ